MSDQMSRILNEISESEELIEAHTPHSESLKENIRRNEKFRQRDVDENKGSTTQ